MNQQFLEAFRHKTIIMVAPASSTSHEKINALRALNTLQPGLTIHIPSNLLAEDIPYHANTDETRFELLKSALLDENSDTIIWALRGGYGCARLLDQLQKLSKPKHPKIFIGFSDNTALHLFLSQQWHWSTIHGSVLNQLVDLTQDTENFNRIADIVSQRVTEQTIEPLYPWNETACQLSTIEGKLTGGNLTLIENSIGTHWEAQTSEKIVFLEEVGEKGYRIDRSLFHLFQAKIFNNVKAIILGEFSAPSKDEALLITFALKRFADDMNTLGIPVYKTDQFGHENKNMPLIYHATSKISLKKDKKIGLLTQMIHLGT